MVKHLDKSDLGEKGFFLAHSSGLESTIAGKPEPREFGKTCHISVIRRKW